jgi:hypothetical protein
MPNILASFPAFSLQLAFALPVSRCPIGVTRIILLGSASSSILLTCPAPLNLAILTDQTIYSYKKCGSWRREGSNAFEMLKIANMVIFGYSEIIARKVCC